MDNRWVLYDIPNENVMYMDDETEVSDEMLRNNIICMPYHQAERIRKAKNLPMPCPPVDVVVSDSLLQPAVEVEIPDMKKPIPRREPRSFA